MICNKLRVNSKSGSFVHWVQHFIYLFIFNKINRKNLDNSGLIKYCLLHAIHSDRRRIKRLLNIFTTIILTQLFSQLAKVVSCESCD